jgi:indole-3-glycerol phosphate synthase
MSAPDVLAELVAAARARVAAAAAQESLTDLAARARDATPRADRFAAALSRAEGIAIIAECKAASPSRGTLVRDYVPASIATAYETAGAAAVSVLTEPARFGGSLAHLAAVRAAVRLPLLRKDFIVDEYQLLEARAAGADAVLLIVAALTQDELGALHERARDLGLAALVEVHDEHELERALAAGARIIGVNNRDLRTLRVDLRTSLRLAPLLPADVTAVAESGIGSAADLVRLRAAGYHAALVGERLVTAGDPGAALRALGSGGAANAAPVTQRVS